MELAVRNAIEKQGDRSIHPTRRSKSAVLTPKGKREIQKHLDLTERLKTAALRADAGPEGVNVTEMSSEDFIAFLRGR